MLKLFKCPICQKDYERTQKQVNAVIKNTGFWRCKSCSSAAVNKSRAKKDGAIRLNSRGYILEKVGSEWRLQHQVIVERAIGRLLKNDEVVHHKNEIKADNSLGNLQIMTHGEHTAYHNKQVTEKE